MKIFVKFARKLLEWCNKKVELVDSKIEKLKEKGKFKKAEKMEKKKWKAINNIAKAQCQIDYISSIFLKD